MRIQLTYLLLLLLPLGSGCNDDDPEPPIPSILAVEDPSLFYYYEGEKQALRVNVHSYFILDGEEMQQAYIHTSDSIPFDSYKYILQDLARQSNSSTISPSFVDDSGREFAMASRFYVKLKAEADSTLLQEEAARYGADITGHFNTLWYTLKCKDKCSLDALDTANQCYESGLFEYATPDFLGNFRPI